MSEKQKLLYEDHRFKIEYFQDSSEDHVLYIKEAGIDVQFILQRGVLRDLARTSKLSDRLLGKLNAIDSTLLYVLEKENIDMDHLRIALAQAYIEEIDV